MGLPDWARGPLLYTALTAFPVEIESLVELVAAQLPRPREVINRAAARDV